MQNDYSQMSRQIIAACNFARNSQLTWLKSRGLTLDAAKRLPLDQRERLQSDFARELASC